MPNADGYIQLPAERRVHPTAMTEASAMVADGALARYAAVTTVMPLLSETTAVVLVMGDGADASLPRDVARSGNRAPTTDWYVDFEPALGSADWRCEVLSLVEPT